MVQCFIEKFPCCTIVKESNKKLAVKLQVRNDNDWDFTITTGYFRISKDEEDKAALVIDHRGGMRDQYEVSFEYTNE